MPLSTWIALLRGINVSGRNIIPMAELRVCCTKLGYQSVQTYIQSGNLIFQADASAAQIETALEQAILSHFNLHIPVIVRQATVWPSYSANNPFLDQSQSQANLVMLALSKAVPAADAVAKLRERAVSGEQIEQVGDVLWVYYADGVARSKLAPALFDRLVGSAVTARNWRTVLKLEELIHAVAGGNADKR